MVKYWPEKGQSGFLVWRYMMQRDDPSAAPWTPAGQKRSKELGLAMQVGAGFILSNFEEKGALIS